MSFKLRYLKAKEYINSWFNISYWRSLRGDILRWNKRRIAYKKFSNKDLNQYNRTQNIQPPYKHNRYRAN